MPYVCGMLLADAEAMIQAAGMYVAAKTNKGAAPSKELAGTVTGQDVDSGIPIPEHKGIALTYFDPGEEEDPAETACDECTPGPACICLLGVHNDECPATLKSPDPPGPGTDSAKFVGSDWVGTSTIVDCSQEDRIGETKDVGVDIRMENGKLIIYQGAFYYFFPTQTGENGEFSGTGSTGSSSGRVQARFTFEGDTGTGVATVSWEGDGQSPESVMKLSYKLRRKQ